MHRQMEQTIRGLVSSLIVKNANPRCQIHVIIQPLESKYCLAPLINCSILALLDAGVKLKQISAAGTVALCPKSPAKTSEMETDEYELLQSPSTELLEKAVSVLHGVFDNKGKLLAVQSDGNFEGHLVPVIRKKIYRLILSNLL